MHTRPLEFVIPKLIMPVDDTDFKSRKGFAVGIAHSVRPNFSEPYHDRQGVAYAIQRSEKSQDINQR